VLRRGPILLHIALNPFNYLLEKFRGDASTTDVKRWSIEKLLNRIETDEMRNVLVLDLGKADI
jgi:hypothetical protein